MQDHTLSSFSRAFTHSKRLYVITGKGGVGKTTTALALSLYLKSKGQNVSYISFKQDSNYQICDRLNIDFWKFTKSDCIKKYLNSRLKSKTITNLILKSSIVSSMLSVLPAVENIIFLGTIIESLENSEDKVFVIDSPSSGHAISLFESSYLLEGIFKKSFLTTDVKKIHSYLENEELTSVKICSLATGITMQESLELKKDIKHVIGKDVDIFVNNSFSKTLSQKKGLPHFLEKKCELEDRVLNKNRCNIKVAFPHISSSNNIQIVKKIAKQMGDIV